MKFGIVTTSFEPGLYILETIKSVIEQAGDFEVHYHIQDANSKDGTIEYLQSYFSYINSDAYAVPCRKFTFSYSVEKDNGMYDGINRGFEYILSQGDVDVMLWINADDKLAPIALDGLSKYFSDNPNNNWVIGRTLHLNEAGAIILNQPPHTYRVNDLQHGLHDGVNLPYVTQEACVWRSQVWDDIGPLDSSLKYAGDFEYWKRIASAGYKLESVDIDIGFHRKRKGQLSSVGAYDEEVLLVKLT